MLRGGADLVGDEGKKWSIRWCEEGVRWDMR